MPMYWSLKNSELGKKENEKLLTIFNESLSNAPFSISLNWIITNWLYSKKVGCYSDRSCFKEPATLEEKDLPELEKYLKEQFPNWDKGDGKEIMDIVEKAVGLEVHATF